MRDKQKPSQKDKRPNKNNNRRRGRNNNRNRRPKALSPAKIVQKYNNLLEQYLIARKKYFEMHARAKGKNLTKIVDNYMRTLKSLFTFEDGLNDWQKEALAKNTQMYPEDNQYSTEHDLPKIAEPVPHEGDFKDEHYLDSQKAASYKGDTEESTGTMDDYNAYKESMN